MDQELVLLEGRLAELIEAHRRLRTENRELNARILHLQAENQRSADKLARAVARVEGILARLPESE